MRGKLSDRIYGTDSAVRAAGRPSLPRSYSVIRYVRSEQGLGVMRLAFTHVGCGKRCESRQASGDLFQLAVAVADLLSGYAHAIQN